MENLMEKFPDVSYDVTNTIDNCCCICCGGAKGTLVMEQDEAVLRKKMGCLTSSVQKRPWAQMNTIENRKKCYNLCSALNSDLAPITIDENGKEQGGILPGCGCENELIDKIVADLNLRKIGRGNIAQLKQQSYMLDRVSKLKLQIPLLLDKHGVQYPPDAATARRIFGENPPVFRTMREILGTDIKAKEFETAQFEVTNCCEYLSCTSKQLTLGPDEIKLNKVSGLSRDRSEETRPYANLDGVTHGNECGCLHGVSIVDETGVQSRDLAFISPGSGCQGAIVGEITAALQERIEERGQVGQIKQLERMMSEVADLVSAVPLLQTSLGVDTAYPPSQAVMKQLYGNEAPDQIAIKPKHDVTSSQFTEKEYNITNMCGNCCCCFTLDQKLFLKNDELIIKTKSCCNEATSKQPYGQLGSVDEVITCGCCYSVNGITPGCGCNGPMVTEIAGELQARKVGRGNIAQLKNQENTMHNALELDVRTDMVLNKVGIAYPPDQVTMMKLYNTPPTLPTDEHERGSGVHIKSSEAVQDRSWDITNTNECICACMKSSLELDAEESVIKKSGLCLKLTIREPYAQMGSVENNLSCCNVCINVQTDQAVIEPGCGCNHALTTEIAKELQHRKTVRGNIAQIKQQENLMIELIKLGVKFDLLCRHADVPLPPAQEDMNRVFGPGATMPPSAADVLQEVRRRSSLTARPSLTTIEVTVPAGKSGGDRMKVNGPRGWFEAEIPIGVSEGMKIKVQIPRRSDAVPLIEMQDVTR